jgi:hypothetical protein
MQPESLSYFDRDPFAAITAIVATVPQHLLTALWGGKVGNGELVKRQIEHEG